MRFVRTNSTKQKVVEIAEVPSLKTKSETAFIPELENKNTQAEETASMITSSASQSDEENEEETSINSEEDIFEAPYSVKDSTTITPKEANSIKIQALRAEKNGTASLILSIITWVLALLLIISLLFSTFNSFNGLVVVLTILGFGLLLASLIVGFILGIRSLRFAYNTPKGRNRAIAGVVISSVFFGLILFNLAFSFF